MASSPTPSVSSSPLLSWFSISRGVVGSRCSFWPSFFPNRKCAAAIDLQSMLKWKNDHGPMFAFPSAFSRFQRCPVNLKSKKVKYLNGFGAWTDQRATLFSVLRYKMSLPFALCFQPCNYCEKKANICSLIFKTIPDFILYTVVSTRLTHCIHNP
jgi:hypothetical protein